jgi:AcrR family transcriptional regulator
MSSVVQDSLKRKTTATTGKGYERAAEILDKAREIFASEGYAGLTMRRVAAALGLSLSHVQHYYKSKDLLVEALLLGALNDFQAKMDGIAASMPAAPRVEQLLATVDMFLDELGKPVIRGMFFEFWALATRNTFASTLMERMQYRERKAIFRLIQGLSSDIDDDECMLRAALIVAQVEGLMLFRTREAGMKGELGGLERAARDAILQLATIPWKFSREGTSKA